MKTTQNISSDQEIIKIFEAAGVVDFLEYLQSGKRLMWINFKAGIAKGLGITLGMTVVLGLLIWVLTLLVDIPIVGEYFQDARQYVTEYAENTNYSEDFEEMNQILQEINENTKTQD